MKRAGHLIEKITDLDNLLLAYSKASRGKQDKRAVLEFAAELSRNMECMRQSIEAGVVDVGHYSYFPIYDPKPRLICAASFPERVLYHALMNICHPVFERVLISDTYATRPGKGVYKAIGKARVSQGVPFLGYRVYPHKLLLNARSKYRFSMKMKRYQDLLEQGLWDEQRYQAHILPLLAFVRHAYTKGLREKLLDESS